MSESSGMGRGGVSLEQLIALNDELLALTRAGMPLERGLLASGADLPRRLRLLTTELGERMGRGESLSEALGATRDVPEVYRAVVEAGVRAGRLPVALEGLATYARGYVEARRAIGLALWYPLIVLVVAYVLFLFLVKSLIPRFTGAFATLGIPVHGVLGALDLLGDGAWYWGPILPILIALFLVSWAASRGARSLDGSRALDVLRWFPWMSKMLARFEASSFADLLALLIEHHVPYPEALRLAGSASGDRRLLRASHDLARTVESGESPSELSMGRDVLPPMLQWIVSTGPHQVDLAGSLRQMARRYRSEARYQAEKIRAFLPAILLFGIGATSTLLYALMVFVPLSTLWQSVASQVR